MFGMKQPLDVAFLGGDGQVIALYHDLRPGQLGELQGSEGYRALRDFVDYEAEDGLLEVVCYRILWEE